MPNHGYCKNCWWWLPVEKECTGVCHMQSAGYTHWTKENSYCPDYINRKKGNKKETIEEWIFKNKL